MVPSRCACGAAVPAGALACGQCHAPVLAAPGPGPAPVAAAQTNGFLPAPPRPTLRMDSREFSRVRQGPLSFGPLGRVLISLAMIAPIWFIWFMSGGGLVTFLCTIPVALLPMWYLRETWRRHRVR